MGLRYTSYIDHPKNKHAKFVTYGCCNCRTHLSSSAQIMSKDYRGTTGDAYLMNRVVNVLEGDRETRCMLTGCYVVCDIKCHMCKNLVGWKYVESERKDQRYKEGKFILELQTICKVH
ncbi:LADA_0D01596g1_1 [Lachancea dasiensis]|uniref:Protein yippee-like n=1 Tax=Lachancea dasiensis TaxID=1072105 RepID=A0A1G4J3W0_9SACH|nr:LADA_0D01596g1_1 [Lachancea dasiensis]